MARSALTFPYHHKQIEFGQIFNPFIYIPVKTKTNWQCLWFLVDSGADVTMLTLSLARKLGLNYDSKRKTKLYGIGKKSVDAYPGKIIIKLGQFKIAVRTYFIDAEDSTLLLGRLDMFERFNITFNTRNRKVVFESMKK